MTLWVRALHKEGRSFTDAMIRDKALEIASKIPTYQTTVKFRASPGWVENFKARMGIRKGRYWGDGTTNQRAIANGQHYVPENSRRSSNAANLRPCDWTGDDVDPAVPSEQTEFTEVHETGDITTQTQTQTQTQYDAEPYSISSGNPQYDSQGWEQLNSSGEYASLPQNNMLASSSDTSLSTTAYQYSSDQSLDGSQQLSPQANGYTSPNSPAKIFDALQLVTDNMKTYCPDLTPAEADVWRKICNAFYTGIQSNR